MFFLCFFYFSSDFVGTDSALPNEATRDPFESSKAVEVQKIILKNEDACQITEGMEDILSIFFNSGKPPGRRKVKVDSRAKRRKKLDSKVAEESAEDQNIFPFLNVESQYKCNKSDVGSKHSLNDSLSMSSSYDWTPLALPDSNITQDMHLPAPTNLVIDEGGKELSSMTNSSPSGNNGNSGSYHVPDEPCKVTNILETSILNTVQPKMLEGNPDMDLTVIAQNNIRDTGGNTSADPPLPIQQVLFKMNEGKPQTRSTNIKATLSVLKKQSKFLYCLNDMKMGQEGTTDIHKSSHSEKDDQPGGNQSMFIKVLLPNII